MINGCISDQEIKDNAFIIANHRLPTDEKKSKLVNLLLRHGASCVAAYTFNPLMPEDLRDACKNFDKQKVRALLSTQDINPVFAFDGMQCAIEHREVQKQKAVIVIVFNTLLSLPMEIIREKLQNIDNAVNKITDTCLDYTEHGELPVKKLESLVAQAVNQSVKCSDDINTLPLTNQAKAICRDEMPESKISESSARIIIDGISLD